MAIDFDQPDDVEFLMHAFIAGFNAAGEGWNGEIVRDNGGLDKDDARRLRNRFCAWHAEQKEKAKADFEARLANIRPFNPR